MDALINEHRVLVCVGSGGVGKTTMAAALALRGRQLGRRVLVVTVDPAKRLASALGLDLTGVEERLVPASEVARAASNSGTLHAAVIDSKKVFDGFIQTHATDPELMKRLAKNRLYEQLSTTLSGSQEFTALERLLQAYEATEADGPKYDLIILDTPPTQHAIDFLSAPDRIRGLFQDNITKWFMNPAANAGFLGQGIVSTLIGRGTKVALKSLEVLTGARFIEELIDFFHSMQSIQKELRDRSEAVNSILKSRSSVFVLVTSFDVAKLKEAQHLNGHLKKFGYRLGACILNRAFPEHLPSDSEMEQPTPEFLRESVTRLREVYKKVRADHTVRFHQFEEFEKQVDRDVRVVRVPEYRQDIFGLSDLESLALFLGEEK
ncbi:MAG: ArsA family ATPase [Deltaproteobacteria bacterium]|nr:ArsA family ATPase [Deltaproteobacteria bacterium]